MLTMLTFFEYARDLLLIIIRPEICSACFLLALRVKLVRPCQLQRIICSRFHVVIAARASHQTFIVVYQSINQSINQSIVRQRCTPACRWRVVTQNAHRWRRLVHYEKSILAKRNLVIN